MAGNPSQRASSGKTTKPSGMGLGLSICESIVSAHGGVLSLAPRVPHGAVLQVELPAAPAALATLHDVRVDVPNDAIGVMRPV